MWKNNKCTALQSYRLGESLAQGSGEITVCYPNRKDTLWSVAKRYNAPILALSENNKLSQNIKPDSIQSLENTEYLVI